MCDTFSIDRKINRFRGYGLVKILIGNLIKRMKFYLSKARIIYCTRVKCTNIEIPQFPDT